MVGTAQASFSRLNAEGGIETVTPLLVEETISGDAAGVVNLVEPGGQYGNRFMVIPGAPRFDEGKRLLLFLNHTGQDRWAVTELVLGKFTFEPGNGGARLLVRDAAEIVGWDGDLQPHRERSRLAAPFLDFVRAEAHGTPHQVDYFTAVAPLRVQTNAPSSPAPAPDVAPYTANSYTMLISGSLGSRWNVFPSPVSWYSGTTQEPGAPSGGVAAIQAAIASWDNDCGSNVNYVYAGADDGSHSQGLHAVDGRNTVLFERDLSNWGISPFSCSSSGYSGTLGIGGVTEASGQNTVNGETFVTTLEGDVEMNRGLANCTLLFNSGDFNSAVTHEIGHTLGFRHADQTRGDNAACSTDPSLECSSNAIMKSFISPGLNAALQTWDQHAVQAVYPGNVCVPGGSCTPPAISSLTSSQSLALGSSVTLNVTATGTGPLSYQWYIGTSPYVGIPISGATGPSVSVSPRQTTTYMVRVSNACGFADSAPITITVTGSCTPPAITSLTPSQSITLGGSVILNVTASGTGPLSYQWYIGTSPYSGIPISGATGPSVTVSPRQTTNYMVRVSNACGFMDSATITITVTSSCSPPAITSLTPSQSITLGSSVTLSVTASGSTPLSYQWYIGSSPYVGIPISGATGPSVTVSPRQTTTYMVRVSNACGFVDSSTITITVTSGCIPPSISSMTPSQTITLGSSVTLTVNAGGTPPLSYQWYIGTSPYTGIAINGATGQSVTVAPRQTTNYMVRVSNACGFVDSPTITITVH